jgi:hypothetical protein
LKFRAILLAKYGNKNQLRKVFNPEAKFVERYTRTGYDSIKYYAHSFLGTFE